MTRPIVLASQSPRRKELLALSVAEFDVVAANIAEKAIEEKVLRDRSKDRFTRLVETLAREKAAAIFAQRPDCIVIGADTVVVHGDAVLGKPIDGEEAYAMLRSYAGKSHAVITGVCVKSAEREEVFSVETTVTFWDWTPLMDQQIRAYIASGSPMDKAGAYGIQEMPSLWIKAIDGDYPNVVGLPISYVDKVLHEIFLKP